MTLKGGITCTCILKKTLCINYNNNNLNGQI